MTIFKSVFIIFLVALFALSGCETGQVISEINPTTNYAVFKTYSLLEWNSNNDSIVDEKNKKILLDAITNELNSRGLVYDENGGDLRVAVHVLFDKMKAKTEYDDYYKNQYNYSYTHNTMGFGQSTTRYEEFNYWEGTLMIDIFEYQSKNLVWQGARAGVIKKVQSTEERRERIELFVSEMFKDFPLDKVD